MKKCVFWHLYTVDKQMLLGVMHSSEGKCPITYSRLEYKRKQKI